MKNHYSAKSKTFQLTIDLRYRLVWSYRITDAPQSSKSISENIAAVVTI